MWLLEHETWKRLEDVRSSGVGFSEDQQVRYESRFFNEERGSKKSILTRDGSIAKIPIQGVLTNSPDIFAFLFGGGNTTYGEIIKALQQAESDESIQSVELAIDSPGGEFTGIFDTIAALQEVSKPITAVVHGMSASAAFAIASQADTITAINKASRIGSVGVVATFSVRDDEVSITSTDAPKKRPDVKTSEGQAVVREELDAMHQIFVEAIAFGRSTTVDNVNMHFGQGATLLAGDALKKGMIDAIAEPKLSVVNNTQSKTTARNGGKMEANMDLKTLKAQHFDVYEAAVQEGIEQERNRASAHLTMGQASGAIDLAITAIEAGEEYTAKHMAQYNAAMLNKTNVDSRQSESDDVDLGDAGANNPVSVSDTVLDLVESKLGLGGL